MTATSLSTLPPADRARLKAADLTYPDAGATRDAEPPAGYRGVRAERVIGSGRARYEQATETLLAWGMQRGAGIRIAASAPRVAVGVVALQRIGPGPLALTAPVRVVYVTEEPYRTAFGYGTLPGHPVSGEEAFAVELDELDRVVATVSAFSRPASRLTRLGGPLGRAGQQVMARRYLAAL